MNGTVSESVHAAVRSSKVRHQALPVHDCALEIARQHGICGEGVWIVEQALVMVGSRAGLGMKIGRDLAPLPTRFASSELRLAANSD